MKHSSSIDIFLALVLSVNKFPGFIYDCTLCIILYLFPHSPKWSSYILSEIKILVFIASKHA